MFILMSILISVLRFMASKLRILTGTLKGIPLIPSLGFCHGSVLQ